MDFITCAFKGTCADQVAQRAFRGESKTKVSWRRTLAYALYAGAYQGCAQHFLYNVTFNYLFGTGTDWWSVSQKVLVDTFFIAPTLCLPSLYVVKALVFGKGVPSGIRSYLKDVRRKGLLFRYWAVWVPNLSIAFSVIPEHFRIVYVALVSFFWLIALSLMASGRAGSKTGDD